MFFTLGLMFKSNGRTDRESYVATVINTQLIKKTYTRYHYAFFTSAQINFIAP